MSDEVYQNSTEMSVVQKLVNIFTSPARVFESLAKKPDWLIPVIVIVVLSIASGYLLKDIQIAEQKKFFMNSEKFTEEQKEQILQRFEDGKDSPMQHVQMIGGIAVWTFASVLLVAGLFLFTGNFIFGGAANYKQLLAIYAWGSMISIIELIVKVPLIISKESMKVYTSLALLFDKPDQASTLFKLANAVDLFSIWRLAVWAIGLGVVYKFSQGKSWAIVLIWYVVYVAVSIGLSSLFGGLF